MTPRSNARQRAKYDPEIRAAAVAAVLAGEAMTAVAQRIEIPFGTLRSWCSRQARLDNSTPATTQVQREEMGDLLMRALRESVNASIAISRQFQSPEWLGKQSASELAVAYGVISDKQVRLLSALSTDPDEPEDGSPEVGPDPGRPGERESDAVRAASFAGEPPAGGD